MYWGYTLSAWKRESALNRGIAAAHFLVARIREAYIAEKTAPKSKEARDKKQNVGGLMAAMNIAG